jgi:hypothetical protein
MVALGERTSWRLAAGGGGGASARVDRQSASARHAASAISGQRWLVRESGSSKKRRQRAK